MKNRVEAILAFVIIGTYCALVSTGKVDSAGFPPIVMYVVKKFMDGIAK